MSDQLPLPDYEHLTTGDLASRIRSLDTGALRTLITHEEAHGARLPVLEVLRHRLAGVEDGAELSAGDPDAARPEQAPPAAGGSPVRRGRRAGRQPAAAPRRRGPDPEPRPAGPVTPGGSPTGA